MYWNGVAAPHAPLLGVSALACIIASGNGQNGSEFLRPLPTKDSSQGRLWKWALLHASGSALLIILDWHRLILLFASVCMGLSLGLLQGVGGVAGTALLLPLPTTWMRTRTSELYPPSHRSASTPVEFSRASPISPRSQQALQVI